MNGFTSRTDGGAALNKKGYLQRVERPHPMGDLFLDPRSVRFDVQQLR